MISLLMWVLIVISCIMQTVHWNDRQQYCNDYRYFLVSSLIIHIRTLTPLNI